MHEAGAALVPEVLEPMPGKLIICLVRFDCIVPLFWMTVANELFCANAPTGATNSSAASASLSMEAPAINTAFLLMAFPSRSGLDGGKAQRISKACEDLFLQSGEGEGVYCLCGS